MEEELEEGLFLKLKGWVNPFHPNKRGTLKDPKEEAKKTLAVPYRPSLR